MFFYCVTHASENRSIFSYFLCLTKIKFLSYKSLEFPESLEVVSAVSRICETEDIGNMFWASEAGENVMAQVGYNVCPSQGVITTGVE